MFYVIETDIFMLFQGRVFSTNKLLVLAREKHPLLEQERHLHMMEKSVCFDREGQCLLGQECDILVDQGNGHLEQE